MRQLTKDEYLVRQTNDNRYQLKEKFSGKLLLILMLISYTEG